MSVILRIIYALAPLILIIIAYLLNYVSFIHIFLIYLTYCTYHFITSQSYLTYHKTDLNNRIINSCKTLEKYKPHFLLPSALVQIILFDHIKGPPVELQMDREEVNNCGVYLDWVKYKLDSSIKPTHDDSKNNKSNNNPILIIIPGLTGGHRDTYVLNNAYEGLINNYNVVVYQNRMLSEKIILPEDSYLDLFDDLDLALDRIEAKFPNSKIFAVGFSYGANKLVHYLGTKNLIKKRIVAGVSVGNPYDLIICQRMLHGTIYDYFILNVLKKNLEKVQPNMSNSNKFIQVDCANAKNAKSVKEFDELFVTRLLGYKTADEYYRGMSCVHHMNKIEVPLLCVSAMDDNITSAKAIPYDEAKMNKNIFLLVTDKGGHLCYVGNESFFELKQWVMKPVVEFLNAVRDIEKKN